MEKIIHVNERARFFSMKGITIVAKLDNASVIYKYVYDKISDKLIDSLDQ